MDGQSTSFIAVKITLIVIPDVVDSYKIQMQMFCAFVSDYTNFGHSNFDDEFNRFLNKYQTLSGQYLKHFEIHTEQGGLLN